MDCNSFFIMFVQYINAQGMSLLAELVCAVSQGALHFVIRCHLPGKEILTCPEETLFINCILRDMELFVFSP